MKFVNKTKQTQTFLFDVYETWTELPRALVWSSVVLGLLFLGYFMGQDAYPSL